MSRNKITVPLFILIMNILSLSAETFKYSGDSMSTSFAKGNEKVLLTGHARLETDTLIIMADKIELYGKDYTFAWCTGMINLVDNEQGISITGDTLYYDREKKISRISGNVYMEDKKNEIILKGRFLENREEEKILLVQIGVRIIKDDLICRSETALYRRDDDLLELTGLPLIYRGKDWFEASRVLINLENDEVNLEGQVQGTLKQSKKEGQK